MNILIRRMDQEVIEKDNQFQARRRGGFWGFDRTPFEFLIKRSNPLPPPILRKSLNIEPPQKPPKKTQKPKKPQKKSPQFRKKFPFPSFLKKNVLSSEKNSNPLWKTSATRLSFVMGMSCNTLVTNLAQVFGALVKPNGIRQNW